MNNVSLNSNENTQQTLLKENQLNEFDENSAKVRSKKFQITKIFNKVEHFLKQIRNAFKSVIPDLKSLKTWQILILCLFALFNFTFSILDFNIFLRRENATSVFKWVNEANEGVPLWQRSLLCLSGISAFTTVLNVVLVIHGKISSYFWGIIGAIVYGCYAFGYGYIGDAQLYILFYFPMQFVGILTWSKALNTKSTTRVRSLTCSGWFFVLSLSGILSVMFYYQIPYVSKFLTKKYSFDEHIGAHVLDALTNGFSVVGECLLVFCYWEQYIIWTFVNLNLIVMYSGCLGTPLDINLELVWVMLTVNSSVGLRTWFKRWKNESTTESINC